MYQAFAKYYDEFVQFFGGGITEYYFEFLPKRVYKGPVPDSLHILEAFCGTGTLLSTLAHGDRTTVGIDISKEMIDLAKRKDEHSRYIVGDILDEDVSFHGFFDLILAPYDGINFLLSRNDLEKFFRIMSRYLRPGGVFVFDFFTRLTLERQLRANIQRANFDSGTRMFITPEISLKTGLVSYQLEIFEPSGDGFLLFTDEVKAHSWEHWLVKSVVGEYFANTECMESIHQEKEYLICRKFK